MPSLWLLAFFITFLDTLKGNTITSCSYNSTCTCQSGEACIIDCSGDNICYHATINAGSATSVTIDCIGMDACRYTTINLGNVPLAGGITCSGQAACGTINAGNHGSQFNITCTADDDYACYGAEINAGNASSVTMYCNSPFGACQYATLNCGVGNGACNIHCNELAACDSVDVICNTASDCTLRCDYGFDWSCSDLRQFDCGTSVCSMYCDGSTGACRNGNNIYPNVTDAISFNCIGVGCSFTSSPTTAMPTQPTNMPTLSPTQPPTSPSNAPSDAPSRPTSTPSINPSPSPSFAPTYQPSTSTPTQPPTSADNAPSNSPTACIVAIFIMYFVF